MARIVLAGYLVRQPLGGYAWQAAHYLLGCRALGHDVWFYEETALWAPAFNPTTGEFGPAYAYGLGVAADFLGRVGFPDRWAFVDSGRGVEHGPAAGRAAALLREADLLINVAGVNRVTLERPWGINNPRWVPYAYGPLSTLLPPERRAPSYYGLVFVATANAGPAVLARAAGLLRVRRRASRRLDRPMSTGSGAGAVRPGH